MKYQYSYRTSTKDLWQLTMYGIYGSMLGTVNLIFTVAMILLTLKFWQTVNIPLKVVLLVGVSLFTIIQPLLIYSRTKKQTELNPEEVTIGLDEDGLHIEVGDKNSYIPWKSVKGLSKKPTMLVIYSEANQGYILSNKILADDRKEVEAYIERKLV